MPRTTTSQKETMRRMVELQEIDSKLLELRALLGDLPDKVEDLKRKEDSLISELNNGKSRLKEIGLEMNKAEHHLEDLKDKISRLKDQLFRVTNNRQYDALMHEIDHLKSSLDNYETRDIELMEEKGTLEETVKSQEKNLETLSKDLTERRENLEKMMAESAKEKKDLEAQRELKLKEIDPRLLPQYQRIAEARKGTAVVPVTDQACSGCGAVVPPQVVADIRAGTGIRTCDVCGRFLYYPDN